MIRVSAHPRRQDGLVLVLLQYDIVQKTAS
jgi:hypothetical protein